jgi:L-malate glycosyltransferase
VQLFALLSGLQRDPDLATSAIFLNQGRLAQATREIGIRTCILDETSQSFFQILLAAARFIRDNDVRVVHSHRYKENLLAALLARRCHVPVHVCTRHGAQEPFRGWRRYKQALIQAIDNQVALRSVDCVVSVSEELRARLLEQLPAEKIVTIHNGIDEDSVCSQFSAAEAKQRLEISEACVVIGTAGRLESVKRLDIFLCAARQIAENWPNSKFVIAGEGTQESLLRDLASKLGLGERVLFLGHRDDVYDIIRAMDIFVICSDHEGLPMALLESLRLGVTVVARPVGGIGEVIEDGVSGIFVRSAKPTDLASACICLLRDNQRRELLARAGEALVAKKFTARQTADETAALYRSLALVESTT